MKHNDHVPSASKGGKRQIEAQKSADLLQVDGGGWGSLGNNKYRLEKMLLWDDRLWSSCIIKDVM